VYQETVQRTNLLAAIHPASKFVEAVKLYIIRRSFRRHLSDLA
jgi:hypothetical protein